ncbi:MAG: hypothetical protein AB7S38_34435 [Vulcanimicrobiota bacterium]
MIFGNALGFGAIALVFGGLVIWTILREVFFFKGPDFIGLWGYLASIILDLGYRLRREQGRLVDKLMDSHAGAQLFFLPVWLFYILFAVMILVINHID